MKDYPILITRKQASELTGLDEKYFDRLRHTEKLRCYRTLGGLHRFYRDEVLEHIGANFVPKQPTNHISP